MGADLPSGMNNLPHQLLEVLLQDGRSLEPSLGMDSAEENFSLVQSLPPARVASHDDSSMQGGENPAF